MRFDDAAQTWRDDGFVILPGYLSGRSTAATARPLSPPEGLLRTRTHGLGGVRHRWSRRFAADPNQSG